MEVALVLQLSEMAEFHTAMWSDSTVLLISQSIRTAFQVMIPFLKEE